MSSMSSLEFGAVGVKNPKKPGDICWLYDYTDLKDVLPDDIYDFIEELMGDTGGDLKALNQEVKEWQEWHDKHLEEDQRVFSDLMNSLDEILEILKNRDKRLDRGDLILRFTAMRKDVHSRF